MLFPGATALVVGLQLVSPPPRGPLHPTIPITVEQAVTEALAHNPDLLADRLDMDAAAAGVHTSRLWPNPTFSFSADHLDLAGTPFTENNGAGPSGSIAARGLAVYAPVGSEDAAAGCQLHPRPDCPVRRLTA